MAEATAISAPKIEAQFAHWMGAVIEEHAAAGAALEADPVHDLRVALRRCLSMAEVFRTLDPDAAWSDLHKQGQRLFKRLGRLRDTQVLLDWVKRIAPDAGPGPVGEALLRQLTETEREEEREARKALTRFNRKRWKPWAEHLAAHAARLPADGPAAEYLATERWEQAYALHRKAVRGGSHSAFHRARIGLKKFRYTVENFLPMRAAGWLNDLKEMQDALGELHDLDLLLAMVRSLGKLGDTRERRRWKERIEELSAERIRVYREKMSGPRSLWLAWRRALPQGKALDAAAMAWIEAWAAFLTPDLDHAKHVRKLALELYDQLAAAGMGGAQGNGDTRRVLEIAALAHDVGRAGGPRSHHKRSCRMIAQRRAPLGWTAEEMRLAGLVARYHRRALPQARHAGFRRLPPDRRQKVLLLAGILRLANAFDRDHDASVRSLRARIGRDGIAIRAGGYTGAEPRASYIASARHLFEIACKRPVSVLPET
jgi:CHAD domain-containing protein